MFPMDRCFLSLDKYLLPQVSAKVCDLDHVKKIYKHVTMSLYTCLWDDRLMKQRIERIAAVQSSCHLMRISNYDSLRRAASFEF